MNSYNCCVKSSLEGNIILSQLSLLKLLADKNRLKMLCILNSDSHTVTQLVDHLEESQSLISHHLISLKEMDLVIFQKKGRTVHYSLSPKGINVLQLLKLLSKKG